MIRKNDVLKRKFIQVFNECKNEHKDLFYVPYMCYMQNTIHDTPMLFIFINHKKEDN